jgi:biotin carboxyl carrier protein
MLFDATLEATPSGASARLEVREKDGVYSVRIGEKTLVLDWVSAGAGFASIHDGARSVDAAIERTPAGFAVVFDGKRFDVNLQEAARGAALGERTGAAGPSRLIAPMPGKIVKILVAPGEAVTAAQGLIAMEAMKMENELKAPRAGVVADVKVAEGQAVETGALLVVIE